MGTKKEDKTQNRYSCMEYREEMMLAGLQRALNTPGLNEKEKRRLQKEIEDLEKKMGLS